MNRSPLWGVVLSVALWGVLAWAAPVKVHASCSDSPLIIPFLISGTLTLDGVAAPSTTITATVTENGGTDQRATSFTTDSSGMFIKTLTPCTGGADPVTFAVEGHEIVERTLYDSGNATPTTVNLSDGADTFTETVTATTSGPVTATLENGAPGVVIAATGGNLGSTQVVVKANQDCTTVAGETVQRCFDITPTMPTTAEVTFYFYEDQIPTGQSCTDLEVFHWGGSGWTQLDRDTAYASSGRDCASDPRSIRVATGTFSPFVIKAGGNPTALTLANFTAHSPTDERVAALLFLAIALLAGSGFTVLLRQRNQTERRTTAMKSHGSPPPMASPTLPPCDPMPTKPYTSPAILYELALETRAGSPVGSPPEMDPIMELLGINVE